MKNFRRAFTLVEIMIVVLIIGILVAIAVPNFIRARETARARACVANLRQIDSAKEQFAMDTRMAQTSTTPITMADICGTTATSYIKGPVTGPLCPSAATTPYASSLISASPVCPITPLIAGHELP